MKINTNRPLRNLSLQEYESLKSAGLLWVHYPEATGDFNQDLQAACVALNTFESGTFSRRVKTKFYFYDINDEEAEYEFKWN